MGACSSSAPEGWAALPCWRWRRACAPSASSTTTCVELSNLNRQILHRTEDVGRPKVQSARDAVLRRVSVGERGDAAGARRRRQRRRGGARLGPGRRRHRLVRRQVPDQRRLRARRHSAGARRRRALRRAAHVGRARLGLLSLPVRGAAAARRGAVVPGGGHHRRVRRRHRRAHGRRGARDPRRQAAARRHAARRRRARRSPSPRRRAPAPRLRSLLSLPSRERSRDVVRPSAAVQGVRKQYPKEALHVCEDCFGPLEVAYDYEGIARALSRETIAKRAGQPVALSRASAHRRRSDGRASTRATRRWCARERLGEALGHRDLWVKNDAVSHPTLSFKDRVVAVALSKAKELGFDTVACASTGNLGNSTAANAAAGGAALLRAHPARSRSGQGARHARLRAAPRAHRRHLRRRQPLVLGDRRSPQVGVRQRQHPTLLRRGLEDLRLRDPGAARLAHAGARRRADGVGLAADEDRQVDRGIHQARARRGARRRPGCTARRRPAAGPSPRQCSPAATRSSR